MKIESASEIDKIRDIPVPEMLRKVSVYESVETTVFKGYKPMEASCHVGEKRIRTLTDHSIEVQL